MLVALDNLAPPSSDNVCSGVASLEGVRTAMFLSELNGLQLCACDIGNDQLEAKTREKLHIIAGPEFGELEEHTLAMFKACCGAMTSDNRFAEKFADDLRDMGFFQSQVDSAMWMCDCGDHCECLCAWVDDMLFASKNPMWLMEELKKKHEDVLKGVGSPTCCLLSDMKRVDKDVHDKSVLTMGSTTHVKRCPENHERSLGFKLPKKASSPMEVKCCPELDTADAVDDQGRQICWSLIGIMMLQCAIVSGSAATHEGEPIVRFFHIDDKETPADIQTKTLPGYAIFCHVKPWWHWVDRNTSPQGHDQQMGRGVSGIKNCPFCSSSQSVVVARPKTTSSFYDSLSEVALSVEQQTLHFLAVHG